MKICLYSSYTAQNSFQFDENFTYEKIMKNLSNFVKNSNLRDFTKKSRENCLFRFFFCLFAKFVNFEFISWIWVLFCVLRQNENQFSNCGEKWMRNLSRVYMRIYEITKIENSFHPLKVYKIKTLILKGNREFLWLIKVFWMSKLKSKLW